MRSIHISVTNIPCHASNAFVKRAPLYTEHCGWLMQSWQMRHSKDCAFQLQHGVRIEHQAHTAHQMQARGAASGAGKLVAAEMTNQRF